MGTGISQVAVEAGLRAMMCDLNRGGLEYVLFPLDPPSQSSLYVDSP